MALVKGTNCGFVLTAPTADPGGTSVSCDYTSQAFKDVVPAGYTKITEIGWWCASATEESNFEVGLYSHDAVNDKPQTRLAVSATNAKGTGSGWKKVTVNWSVSPGQTYWMAFQLDDTATATYFTRTAVGGERRSVKTPSDTLTDPWETSTEYAHLCSIYCKVEVGGITHHAATIISATSTVIQARYRLTGTLSPDQTGQYDIEGQHEGKPYYKNVVTGWFLWWNPLGAWMITEHLDEAGDSYWGRGFETIEGEYLPQGSATGIGTLSILSSCSLLRKLFTVVTAVSTCVAHAALKVAAICRKYFWLPGPYAAKAICEHEFDIDHLDIYVTFRHPMNIKVFPPLTKWNITVDDVEMSADNSTWLDEWTLRLTVVPCSSRPDRVLVEYKGPDPNLRTTWKKQWEPWGSILSLDITT
jgi:hypothetical protein